MDGTLGSQNRVAPRRLRRADHERRGARRDHPAGCRGRLSGRRARDRRPGEPRSARRIRAARAQSGHRSACATESSTHSCSRPRTSPASPSSASPARCSSPTPPPTAISPTGSGAGSWPAPTPTARSADSGAVVANGSDAPIEELDPLAGIRAGVRRNDRRARSMAVGAGADRRAGVRGDHGRPGLADRGRAPPGQAASRLRRRPRRARSRPVGRSRRRGRGDDGRRPLGAQPAALGLTTRRSIRAVESCDEEELSCGCDPERDVLGDEPLVRRVDVRVGQAEAGDDRRDPLVGERGHDRQRSARSGSAPAGGRARARTRRARAGSRRESGGTSPGGDDDQQLDLELGARRRRLAEQPLELGRDLARPSGRARAGSRGSRPPRPAAPSSADAESRSRTRSRRAPARRRCGGRTPRRRAGRPARAPCSASSSAPVGSSRQPASSSSRRRDEALRAAARRAARRAATSFEIVSASA